MRKWYGPQQPHYAEYDQRHTYPMDQFIGWVLMAFGILGKVDIDRTLFDLYLIFS